MKKTVGSIAPNLAAIPSLTHDPIELQREMQKNYLNELTFTIKCALKKINCLEDAVDQDKKWHKECHKREAVDHDFYIEVQTKKEHLFQNILRNQFAFKYACPTPTWDQGVYKYSIKNEQLEFLWQVPDRATCNMLESIKSHTEPEQEELLKTVLMFKDGSLEAYAKRLNGEKEDSPFLKKD